jgi:hypothetical protein
VFLVKKDASSEDVDLDMLLGKLDAPDSPAATPSFTQPAAAAPSPAPQKKSASEIRGAAIRVEPPPQADEEEFNLDALLKSAEQNEFSAGEESADPSDGYDLGAALGDDGADGFDLSGLDQEQGQEQNEQDSYGEFGSLDLDQGVSVGEAPSDEHPSEFDFGSVPEGFSEESLHTSINQAFGTDGEMESSGEDADAGSLDMGSTDWGSGSFSLDSEGDNGGESKEESDELADLLGFNGAGGAEEPQEEDHGFFNDFNASENTEETGSFDLPGLDISGGDGGDEQDDAPDFAIAAPSQSVQPPSAMMMPPQMAAPVQQPAPEIESESSSLAIVFSDVPPPKSSSSVAQISFDEHLPPLGISSRKKESAGRGMILLLFVVVLFAVAGSGFFLYRSKPDLLESNGLGGVVHWLDAKLGGAVIVQKVTADYLTNPEAGELFVIRGEVKNDLKRSVPALKIKANLYGSGGTVVVTKTVSCCGSLTTQQLETQPLAQLKGAAESATVTNMAPGQVVPFVVLFDNVPAGVENFGVETLK